MLFWVAPSNGIGFEFEPLSTAPENPCADQMSLLLFLAEQIGQVWGLCAVIASAIPCAKFTSISANFWASTFENLPFTTTSLKKSVSDSLETLLILIFFSEALRMDSLKYIESSFSSAANSEESWIRVDHLAMRIPFAQLCL